MRHRRWFVAFAALAALLAVLVALRTSERAPGVPLDDAAVLDGAVSLSSAELAAGPGAAPAGEGARTAAVADEECTVVCEVMRGDLDPFPGAVVSVEIGTASAELRTADARGLVHVVVRGAAPAKVTFAAGTPQLVGRPAVGYSQPGHTAPKVRLRLRARDVLVRGVVTDTSDRPLANARVSWSRDEAVTLCDAAGRFEVRVPSDWVHFRCLFLAPGFRSHRENLMLAPGVPVDLRVRLQPGPRVLGRVVDAEGRAVAAAVVETILHRISGTPAVTDAEGRYEIDCTMDFSGPQVQVAVRSSGFVPASAHVSTANGDATCDFTLQRAGVVRGTVRRPDGRPAGGAQVSTSGDGYFGNTQESTATDEHGRFVLDEVALGAVELRVRCAGFPPASASAVVVAGAPSDVTITLIAGAVVRGVVVDGDGRPVRGVHVMHGSGSTRTDGRGRFELDGIPPGPVLEVDVMAGDYVQRRSVVLSTTADNRVELARAGTLQGTVVDARTGVGLDDFTITIVNGDYQNGSIGANWGREGQRFQRTAGRWKGDDMMLVPGSEWRVRITAPGYAAVTHTFVANVEHLLVEEVEMTTGVSVTGRLVSKLTATAAGNAAVHLLDRAPDQRRTEHEPRVRSGADGTFTFAAVAPGNVWLAITAAGMPEQKLGPFPVGATDRDLGELLVGEGAAIGGTLCDDEGRPAADCTLHASSVHADSASPRSFETRTRGDGTFVLSGLTPGTWRLWTSLTNASDGVPIAIDHRVNVDGGEQRLEVRPAGPGIVRGEVRGTWSKDAQPTVVVRRKSDVRDLTAGFSGSASLRDGTFAIGGLAPGSYDVTVMSGRRFACATVAVEPGTEPAPIVLDLGTQ
jgi:hypothetical protein